MVSESVKELWFFQTFTQPITIRIDRMSLSYFIQNGFCPPMGRRLKILLTFYPSRLGEDNAWQKVLLWTVCFYFKLRFFKVFNLPRMTRINMNWIWSLYQELHACQNLSLSKYTVDFKIWLLYFKINQ